MPYPAKPIPFDPGEYAKYPSLRRAAAFVKGADAATRQAVIDYVVTAQEFSKTSTKSLVYDAGLNQPGKNEDGKIRIGPSAFEKDLAWLAGIVFHELVHSPQAAYYASKGVTGIDPTRSEIERRMIALDEYEAYTWTLKRCRELSLSKDQVDEIRDRARNALIDLDDAKPKSLAQSEQFDAARDNLIEQFKATQAGKRASIYRRKSSTCYA